MLKLVIIVLFGLLQHVCKSHVLIKGDMVMESSLRRIQKPQTEGVCLKRNAVADRKFVWDYGVVPYDILSIDTTAVLDQFAIGSIKAAMRQWENSTCIVFIERNSVEHKDFIRFIKRDAECGCCSNVGKQGGGQEVAIGDCQATESIVHELGHAIGFYHEHERPDRDDYIEIIQKNVERSIWMRQYEKVSSKEIDTFGEPYDFDSIMHYDPYFVKPKKGKNGIVPKLGYNIRLSDADIRKANKLYKCPECGRTYFFQVFSFYSPEYYSESTYKTHQSCQWRIKVLDGQRIRLKINDLNIFKSNDCNNDYLEVHDGYWHKSSLLGRFCGNNNPEHIVSTGNRLIISYVSTHQEYRGFTINYSAFIDENDGELLINTAKSSDASDEVMQWNQIVRGFTSATGTINFDGFMNVFEHYFKRSVGYSEYKKFMQRNLKMNFERYDQEGNGYITISTFRKIWNEFKERFYLADFDSAR